MLYVLLPNRGVMPAKKRKTVKTQFSTQFAEPKRLKALLASAVSEILSEHEFRLL